MKIKYFCEECGALVQADALSCPECKSLFKGIRCPQCFREGIAGDFFDGCPQCGFMMETIYLSRGWPQKLDCSASRYWILSAILLISIAVILYLWLHS